MFIDANIFLELALEDKRSDECEKLFLEIKRKNLPSFTSDFIFYTCLIQIENKLKPTQNMEDFMIFIDNIESLDIVSPRTETVYDTFKIMRTHNLDFDDSLVVAMMKSLNIIQLVSFDKHFDKIKEIKRIEPQNILDLLQKEKGKDGK